VKVLIEQFGKLSPIISMFKIAFITKLFELLRKIQNQNKPKFHFARKRPGKVEELA
jgi:hypothetical protein